MSYILDALRRADAERERGAVPGLHAQAALPGTAADEPRRGSSPLTWMAVGAALVLGAALAWTWSGSESEPAPAPVAVVPPPPGPAPAAVPQPAPPLLGAAPVIESPPKPPVTAASSAPKAQAQAQAERVVAIAELPENIRRELPPMTIGGSIYSETVANRFVIINGQIFHEGDQVAKDLTLEQIKLKAAVLRFRTYRIGISF